MNQDILYNWHDEITGTGSIGDINDWSLYQLRFLAERCNFIAMSGYYRSMSSVVCNAQQSCRLLHGYYSTHLFYLTAHYFQCIWCVIQTVAGVCRVCLGCYIAFDLIHYDALLVCAAVSDSRLLLEAEFVNRFVCFMAQTYIQLSVMVYDPLRRVIDSVQKHYGAAGRVLSLSKLSINDHRLQDDCAVCLTKMNADSSRLTPCGHAFHGRCLQLCLRRSRECPICRHCLLTSAI